MPGDPAAAPQLSLVVGCFEMQRELPRTLHTLAVPYQHGVRQEQYEVVVVDNGSTVPVTAAQFAALNLNLRVVHVPGAPHSPLPALNRAVAETSGGIVGMMIDGARMLSPGVLDAALRMSQTGPRTIVATLNFHLGPDLQWISLQQGYNQTIEDRLLDAIDWRQDGYRLFDIGVRPDNCKDGWFGALSESNALFMPRALWDELDGYDTAFSSPGGGAANVDLFGRATALADIRLVVLLGEASFHQVHGGVSTNAGALAVQRLKEHSREMLRVRGKVWSRARVEATYYGPTGAAALAAFERAPLSRTRPHGVRPGGGPIATRYIDLVKTVLLNEHGLEREAQLGLLRADSAAPTPVEITRAAQRLVWSRMRGQDVDVAAHRVPLAYTMIGRARLENLAACVATVLEDGIPGDLIECGVWRGGAAMLMRALLAERGVTDRRVWLADSFSGLPLPRAGTDDGVDISAAVAPELAVSLEQVQANFAAFGLLDHQVCFLRGWFADTLPQAPIGTLAVLRVDGDLYSSTMDVLEALYDRVAPGGFVIIDDYGPLDQCARAVHDFRDRRGITEPLEMIDCDGAVWRRAWPGQSA